MPAHLPLNALRAFEAAARHLSFTHAAGELNVTQAAVSQQVRALEDRLGCALFRRLPRGLGLTAEGQALLPVLSTAFGRIESALQQFAGGQRHEVLTVGVVGTFAIGWLMPRLPRFREVQPFIEVRLLTHNNLVDLASEGLDCAIRFGEGLWPDTRRERLLRAPLSPLCTPVVAARLGAPETLAHEVLLRSYRSDEWPQWFAAAGVEPPPLTGPVFDSSRLMVEAAILGAGVALAPPTMFARELRSGLLVQPFATHIDNGAYWLTQLRSREPSPAMQAFRDWIVDEAAQG